MEEMLIIPKKEFQGDVQQYKEELTSFIESSGSVGR